MSPISPMFPFQTALEVFLELLRHFDPRPAWGWDGSGAPEHCPNALCERICAMGSMQKRSPEVDVLELLVCPRVKSLRISGELFGESREIDLTDELIARLVRKGIIEPGAVWSPSCKHARHVATGVPVIFHFTTAATYTNRLKELQPAATPLDSIRSYGDELKEQKAA